MSNLPSQNLQVFHPTTFLERGVAVPFTSPLLAGARARPAERAGVELVIPNPSGGKGAYVVPWTSIKEMCRPTVHDLQLNERIAGLRSVTPGTIRAAARSVALSGLAGREAGAAARQAAQLEAQAQVVTNFGLLLRLVKQAEPPGACPVPPEQERPAELELRAKRAIAQIAPRLGQEPEVVAGHLEELAALLCPVGLGSQATDARLPRMLAALKQTRQEVAAWAAANDDAPGAGLLVATADVTIACAGDALQAARAGVDRLLDLLAAWAADSPGVARRVARPDWLMDGWEQICLLWAVAGPARRAALADMSLLLPVIPREAAEWVGYAVEVDSQARQSRSVTLNQDWRTGASIFDAIARNEQIRALAA